MTREERNIKLKRLITCMKCEVSGKVCDKDCPTQYEVGNMGEIIENLEAISEIIEQQSCEDCISREKTLMALTGDITDCTIEEYIARLREKLNKLPPVTPKEKTGHWIDDADKIDAQFGKHTYKCSECGKYAEYFVSGTEVWWDRIKPNFCPNCGARMVESEKGKVRKYG